MAQGSGIAVIASFVQAATWWTAANANVAAPIASARTAAPT